MKILIHQKHNQILKRADICSNYKAVFTVQPQRLLSSTILSETVKINVG